MHKLLILLSAVLLVLTGSVFSLNAAETRTWNDSSGLFSVEASLVGIDGKKVKLKKADGKVVSLPLSKLSEEDQKYIDELVAANPFEGGEESGEEKAPKKTPSRLSKPKETEAAAGAKKLAKFPAPKPVDLENVPEAGGPSKNSWSCQPDPVLLKAYSQKVKNLSFSTRGLPEKAHPSHHEFFINPGTGQTVIASLEAKSIGSRKDADHLTRIFLGDAFAGTTVSFDSPLLLKPFGLSPDGKKALFFQDSWDIFDKERKRSLHILKVSPGLLEPWVSYEPFSYWKQDTERHLPATEIQWAGWVDDDHVLVLSGAGWLILLKTDSGKAVWKFKTDAHSKISLSPGGKYCIVPKGSDVFLLETAAGTPIGRLGGLPDNAFVMRFEFSPDGEHIAACSEDGAMIWNATDGKYQEPFYIKGNFPGQSVVWIDGRYFLLGSRLIDSKKQTQVWNYVGINNNNIKTAGEYSWCFSSHYGDDSFLVPFALPHKEMDQGGETTFAVDSGTGVSLVLDPSVAEDREKIQDVLKKKFDANGWVLAEDAPISVVLKVEEEKPKTTEYVAGSPFRPAPLFRGGGTEIEFKPTKYSIAVQKGDEMLWGQYYITTPPQHVSLDQIKDTSLQEIVKESLEEQKYQKWFAETEFPKKITLPPDRNKTSLVSEKGIDDTAAKFVPDERQQQGSLRPMKGQRPRGPFGLP